MSSEAPSQKLVEVSNALCRIGRRALLKIDSFAIAPGEHWCLFGPNGAGKTLLANLIAGSRVESGSYVSYAEGFQPARDIHWVSFEEQQRLWQRDNRLDISEYSAEAADAGTLVEILIRSSRRRQQQDEALLACLVAELELDALLGKGIRYLSSGQTRKVLIARALYAARDRVPQLLILDEPLESIDRDSQQHIARCIALHLGENFASLQLCRRAGDVLPGATHMALMRALELLQQGPMATVRQGEVFRQLTELKPGLPERIPVEVVRPLPPLDSSKPLIELIAVNAGYGELKVLRDVNWCMRAGDHVLIQGPNGCGKSTLLSLIDGENHKAYGQQVNLFGRRRGSGETVWEVKARFGVVSNELHNRYVKGWKVLDVVISGFFDSVGLYDDSGAAEADMARRWLTTLAIAELEKHYYHEISFGQQRLVLLARAMVKQPAVLVLDEPCVGLDDYHRQLILQMLDRIAAQTATSMVYVSHAAGEQPGCINQKLSFVAAETGFRLQQESVQPRM